MKEKLLAQTVVMCLLALAARASQGAPKVLLMMDEQNMGSVATAEAENMAVAMLTEKGVRVVDQDLVRANQKRTQALMQSVGDARAAAAVGLEMGADVVISGSAVAKPSPRRIGDSNFRAYEAVVTLKAIKSVDGTILAVASETYTKPGLDDVSGSATALKGASKKAMEQLIPVLLKSWSQETGEAVGGVSQLQIKVGGIDQLWKLKTLREQLKGMGATLQGVEQQKYTLGSATFVCQATKPVEEVAEALVMHAADDLRIQVLSIERGKIEIRATVPQ